MLGVVSSFLLSSAQLFQYYTQIRLRRRGRLLAATVAETQSDGAPRKNRTFVSPLPRANNDHYTIEAIFLRQYLCRSK